MSKRSKGIAPLIIVLIIALVLVGGTAVGYGFREPIKKVLSGQTSAEELKVALDKEVAKLNQGKDKFELEGVVTAVNVAGKEITVKIKSSTNSIKELRLSEAPVSVSETAEIQFGDKKDLKIGDIPIDSQVHAGGTINDSKLIATKIIVQKEDVEETQDAAKEKDFEVGGTAKSVGAENIVVTVSSANKKANSQKGKDLTITVNPLTAIKKGDAVIALADIKAGDNVEVEGVVANDVYTALNIKVEVEEKAGEIEEGSEDNRAPSSPAPSASQKKNGERENSNSHSDE